MGNALTLVELKCNYRRARRANTRGERRDFIQESLCQRRPGNPGLFERNLHEILCSRKAIPRTTIATSTASRELRSTVRCQPMSSQLARKNEQHNRAFCFKRSAFRLIINARSVKPHAQAVRCPLSKSVLLQPPIQRRPRKS
jgi:hypothetical protein